MFDLTDVDLLLSTTRAVRRRLDLRGPVEGLPLGEVTAVLGSIYPAVWSFQLALRSRGLGSVFTTAHLLRAGEIAALLGIPPEYTQTCLIPVAYTIGTDFAPARRRPVEEVVSWNGWEPAAG